VKIIKCVHIQQVESVDCRKCVDIGRRDGQTMMVRQVNCIEAYQWNASESRWIKVGNVVGGSNDSQTTSGRGKTRFEGKVWYVMNIFTVLNDQLVCLFWPLICSI